MNMAGVDKFGIIFTIAFAAAMIAIMGGLLQVDTSSSSAPSIAAPTQTYSPPPTPAATQPSVTPQAAPQTSDSDNLKYTIRGGIVDSISKDENHNAVKIMMDSRFDGQMTITLTSDSVTPFDDGTYFVTIDGEEVDFTHVGKKLIIDFMANSQKIMIFGDGHKSDGHDAKDKDAAMMQQTKPQQTKPQQTKQTKQQTKPQQTKPQQTKPQQTKPQQTKPQQTKPQQTKPQQTKPQQTKPQQTKQTKQQTKPQQTKPQQTKPQQTKPQQTKPQQTKPQQQRHQWLSQLNL